jgi:adenine-specific DNA-methyltransferase
MPTLQFKGKNAIWNHHLSVPYHTLEEVTKLDFQADKGAGNLIVEGDNLLALKALLPQYQGKIKCVYIDPPYNTGNEGWVYNDKVNSPLIKEWLGKEVGKDDLTRHDKWLCMIVPRLKLLRDLMADDGAVFISIDDNEQHVMRQVLDEIFGEENFVANVIWQKKYAAANDDDGIAPMHDFVIVYSKTSSFSRNLLPRTEEQENRYTNPDNDKRGPWASDNYLTSKSKEERPTLWYPVVHPKTKEKIWPDEKAVWRYSKEKHEQMVKENRLYWGPTLNYKIPRLKRFLSEIQDGVVPNTWWTFEQVGHNDEAKKEVSELFGDKKAFQTPKPVRLLERILKISTGKSDLILDSFAGSGTTMHAVMDLNKEDGGKRKCILVQMPESSTQEPKKNICKDITRERVKRAIEKNGYKSGFKYLRVGEAIDAETLLAGKLPNWKTFAEYVYYVCTGEHLADKAKANEKTGFVGARGREAVYLLYKADYQELSRMALNLEVAERILKEQKGKKCIVYAPACFLEEDYLRENNIEFVGIPYNLFRRNGQ